MSKDQFTHLLLVFSRPVPGKEEDFRHWYSGRAAKEMEARDKVVSVCHYAQYPIHINTAYPQPGFGYLSICRLCLDGALDGEGLMDEIQGLYADQPSVEKTAFRLYYPIGEKVGDTGVSDTAHISIAYANAVEGREDEFREWYTTCHVRHALIIPALITGQVFERTGFQKFSGTIPEYSTIALYQMGETPEALMKSIPSINPDDLAWSPSGDVDRFTEWFYQLL